MSKRSQPSHALIDRSKLCRIIVTLYPSGITGLRLEKTLILFGCIL
jgi:hypothetical protein